MHLFGLNWQLQESDGYGTFENGAGGRDTTANTFMVSTDNGEAASSPDLRAPPLTSTELKLIFTLILIVNLLVCAGKLFLLENNTIDIGEVDVGRRAIQDVPPGLSLSLSLSHSLTHFRCKFWLPFNVTDVSLIYLWLILATSRPTCSILTFWQHLPE